MAICKTCGKKYSKLTTPVSAKGVCSECFFAQLEAEASAGDPQPAQERPSDREVTVLGEHVRFPRVCPHCLADASVPLGLPVIRFRAYIFMRHHTIYAPFCHSYAKKVVWVQRLWKTCVILFLVLVGAPAGFFHISNPPVWPIFILVGALIARLYWNHNKYIRITDTQKDSIQFSIANPIYAREFRRLNATSL